jgi:putative inorganic carbon (hco3(-)) transporter
MVNRILIFLDRLHWLWLVLTAPFLLFPSPKRSLAMLVIPALFLLRWLALKAKQKDIRHDTLARTSHLPPVIPYTPLNGVLLLMMAMVLVSLWATFDINYSLPKISGMLLGMGAFLAIVREGENPRGWMFGLLAFLVIGLLIATLGVFGTNWFPFNKIAIFGPIIIHLPRLITGLQGAESGFHPNEVAGGLIWVLPVIIVVTIILFLRHPPISTEAVALRKDWKTKFRVIGFIILSLGATFFLTMVFLLCQSRGGYIGLAITFVMLIPVALPPKWRWPSMALLALIAVFMGILIASHWEAVRVWLTGSNLVADPALSLNTLAGRVEIWSRAIFGIQDFPFTGMGMNTFRKVAPVLYPLFNVSPEIDIGHAHNEFLQAALDLGIPGLVAFLALYIGSFWMLTDTWRTTRCVNPGTEYRSLVTRFLVIGLGGGLLAHLLYGLTDAVSLGAKPGILFWILLGLITALHKQTQEQLRAGDNHGLSEKLKKGYYHD